MSSRETIRTPEVADATTTATNARANTPSQTRRCPVRRRISATSGETGTRVAVT